MRSGQQEVGMHERCDTLGVWRDQAADSWKVRVLDEVVRRGTIVADNHSAASTGSVNPSTRLEAITARPPFQEASQRKLGAQGFYTQLVARWRRVRPGR